MTVLVLSGTGEGRQIAQEIAARGVAVIASLAGATRAPRAQGVETRIGGFGGAEGFVRFVKDRGITAVLDATHPFAHRITHRSARICAELGVPYCLFLRPAWVPEKGDNWTMLADESEAAQHIPDGSVVFLATGRQTLERFSNLPTCTLLCRQIDPPEKPFPFDNGSYVIGRPPFSVKKEVDLFEKHNVDWLIVKNAGSLQNTSKLIAARQLGIQVGMIERPANPDAPSVPTVAEAVDWAVQAHG